MQPSAPYQQSAPVQRQQYTSQPSIVEQPASRKPRNTELLQPISTTVRNRVSFYGQRAKAWHELEQNKSRYRTPEQSRKLISCQSKVAALHDAYTELQIQLFNERNLPGSHEKILVTQQHLQHKDFSYLEGACPALFKQLSTSHKRFIPEAVAQPEGVRRPAINFGRNIFSSDRPHSTTTPQYQNQYEQSRKSPQKDLITPPEPAPNYEERYQYAQSLLKQGREEEARRILSDLLASVRQTGNSTLQRKILKNIAELEFALRNYLPARILYEELEQLNAPFDRQHLLALQAIDTHREEVDAYAALLLSTMTFDPAQDGFTVPQQGRAFLHNFPTSPLRSHVKKLVTKAEQEAEQWFQQLIQQFDRFVINQQPNEALTLLQKVPLDILPLDKQEIIRQRKDALTAPPPVEDSAPVAAPANNSTINEKISEQAPEKRETLNQEQPEAQTVPQKTAENASERRKKASSPQKKPAETALQKKWNKAEEALQATEYDKAITLFSDLRNTSLNTQALKKLKKASQAAGQEARRKAAHFFQRANSATDPDVKKQHLLSSKTILEDILQKYPLAGLDAKVKRNLSRVDKELSTLDHMPE
ncbi:hypothetical protein [Candidatus Electrothrix sp.]|uniref:hypothetical protein n=1 Tax=Candidatus Electrothrix sp. TaxID=2170559 RepID=UPI004055DFC7